MTSFPVGEAEAIGAVDCNASYLGPSQVYVGIRITGEY